MAIPRNRPITMADTEQFHRARAALERDGLLVQFENPGGSLGTVGLLYGLGMSPTGRLWVMDDQMERVTQCLVEAGLPAPLDARPIIDRSDPTCLDCGTPLDPDGPDVCPECGAAFSWVDIEQMEFDRTGRSCRTCGYDLTGTVGKHCPECEAEVTPHVDEIVEQALGEHPGGAAEVEDVTPRSGDTAPARVKPAATAHPAAGALWLLFFIATVVALLALINGATDLALGAGLAALVAVLLARVIEWLTAPSDADRPATID